MCVYFAPLPLSFFPPKIKGKRPMEGESLDWKQKGEKEEEERKGGGLLNMGSGREGGGGLHLETTTRTRRVWEEEER